MSSIVTDTSHVSPERPTSTSVVPSPTNRRDSIGDMASAQNDCFTPPKRSQSAEPLRKYSSSSSTSSLRRDSSSNSINEMHMDDKLFTNSDQKKILGAKLRRYGSIPKDKSVIVDRRKKKNRISKKYKLSRQSSSDSKQRRWEHQQYSAPSAVRQNSWGLESLSGMPDDEESVAANIVNLTLQALTSGLLHLTRMKLKSFPKELVGDAVNETDSGIFQNIVKINLYKNRIKDLPMQFFRWFRDNLVDLHLNENVFLKVPEGLRAFQSLEKLNMANNRIKDFPLHLTGLLTLQELNLSTNRLSDFPKSLVLPSSLRILNLSKNKLCEIPRPIFELQNLHKLHLSNNVIEDIPPGITQMTSLSILDIRNNMIEELPSDIFNCRTKLKKLKTLLVKGNPLYMPPRSILNSRPEKEALKAVRHYFNSEEHSTASRTHFKRISKAVFLGAKGAGKTSCVELLLDKGKTISECSREIAKPSIGIEISELTISSSEDDVKLPHKFVLWDMVASDKDEQYDYKGTLKLFLNSSKAVYIVVFNMNVFRDICLKDPHQWNEKEKEHWNLLIQAHIGEWVQSVHNHVPDARIILCGTHMDKIPSRKRKQVLQCVCDVMIQKAKAHSAILKVRLQKLNKVNLPSLNTMIKHVEKIYETSLSWEASLTHGCIFKLSMPGGACVDQQKMQNNRNILRSKILETCKPIIGNKSKLKAKIKIPKIYIDVRDVIFELRAEKPFFKVDYIIDCLEQKYEESSDSDSEQDISSAQIYVDDDMVINALEFLNDCSDIIFFRDARLVFVNVSWVVSLISRLLIHTENRNTCIVTTNDLLNSWKDILVGDKRGNYENSTFGEEIARLEVRERPRPNMKSNSLDANTKESDSYIDINQLPKDIENQIECLYNLMQQFGILFPCLEPHKSLMLCKIPVLDVNDEKLAHQFTKRFSYPLENDVEVARLICFENGYVPHGLMHLIQAKWVEYSNDGESLPNDTSPYLADAAILHSTDDIQIYIRFGNTKGGTSTTNGSIFSQISDVIKQRYHDFLGIFVRHSTNIQVHNDELEYPRRLHKYCNLIMRIVLGVLTTKYPGLIVTVKLPCPMCCRKYPHVNQATWLDVLDIYEEGEGGIMCEKCKQDKLSGSSFGIPIQQTIPMDYNDAGEQSNHGKSINYGPTAKRLSEGRRIMQSPAPAIVSVGLVDTSDGSYNIVELGSGVCLDDRRGVFLTAAHIVFKEHGKYVGHDTKIADFDCLEVYIGLYQGESRSPKWAFRADKTFLKKVMVERQNREISDDVLILRAYQKFRYYRTPSFGSSEDTISSDREYLQPSITNVQGFQNAKDSVQESLQVTLSRLRRENLDERREIYIFGYPGTPQGKDLLADENCTSIRGSLPSRTGQGKICWSICHVDSVDDQYIYAYDLVHNNGSSGGPVLVKVNDCTEYAVIGVIVGTDNKERKFIVAQEKCEWMLQLL